MPWDDKEQRIKEDGKSFLFSLSKDSKHESLKKKCEMYGSRD